MRYSIALLIALLVHCQALYYVVDENKKVYDYLFGQEEARASLSTFPLCFDDGTKVLGESKSSNMTVDAFRARMRAANSSFMDVRFFLKLFQVTQVSEREQKVQLIMGIDLRWVDCRLSWAAEESSAHYIDLSPQKFKDLEIFMPTLLFLESTEPTAGKDAETKATILQTGRMLISSEFAADISCNIDVRMYPFDTQLCKMTFESAFNSEAIKLIDGISHDTVDVQSAFLLGKGRFIPSDTWDVVLFPAIYRRRRTCVEKSSPFYNTLSCFTDSLQYRLLLQRHPTYQIVNLMVPAFMVIIISSCVFVIPPGSGDKMGLSVTILLSMFVFTQLMYDKMPETGSSLPLLSQFFMVCVALVSASCLYSAVSAVLANATRPVPKSIQNFVKLLAPWLLADMMKQAHKEAAQKPVQNNQKAAQPDQTGTQITNETFESENESSPGMHIDADHEINWHATAALIDRVFFIFHIVASVAVLIGFIGWGYSAWLGNSHQLSASDQEFVLVQTSILESREE